MKKLFTLLTLALVYISSQAQWSFSSGDFPAVGETQDYTSADTVGFNPGPSGSGQSWNFSALNNLNSTTWRMVTPSTAPQGANYPAATHAWVNSANDYRFYKVNTDTVYLLGEKSIASTNCHYLDSGAVMAFPFSFGNSISDSMIGQYADGFISQVTRKGEVSVEYDGSGTLTTPLANYTNVARIHRQFSHNDSSWTGAANAILFIDEYEWYVQGTHFPVMYYKDQTLVLNGGNPQITRTVLYAGTHVGVDGSQHNALQASLFPNPSNGNSAIRFTLPQAEQVAVSVYNIAGSRVSQTTGSYGQGSHEIALNMDQMPKGIYMVHIQAGTEQTTQKLVVE